MELKPRNRYIISIQDISLLQKYLGVIGKSILTEFNFFLVLGSSQLQKKKENKIKDVTKLGKGGIAR